MLSYGVDTGGFVFDLDDLLQSVKIKNNFFFKALAGLMPALSYGVDTGALVFEIKI